MAYLTTSTLWLPSLIFLIFTLFFQFRRSTLNMNTPCLSVARNGVAFERISILTKYHLGFAAKKVLENGDEDMKIFLWASLKTREVKMNSAVWAFGWPHACKHKGTFSNQVGTIQSEPFKFIIFNTVHTLWKGGKKNALYIIKESGTLLHPDAGNPFLFATQIPKISRNIHSYWAANWWS